MASGAKQKWRTSIKTHRDVYNSWNAMMARCYCPNHPAYHNYGGRGIEVCQRWHSFDNFFDDLYPRPVKHSLDRINNDGNYEMTNCRWANAKVQGRKSPKRVHDTNLIAKNKKRRLKEISKKKATDRAALLARREIRNQSYLTIRRSNKPYYKANTKRNGLKLEISQDFYDRAMDMSRELIHIANDCGCAPEFIREIRSGKRSVY